MPQDREARSEDYRLVDLSPPRLALVLMPPMMMIKHPKDEERDER